MQQAANRKKVSELADKLLDPDEATRTAAAAELTKMGPKAVAPLLVKLKETLTGQSPNPQMEKAIISLLKQIAPQLNRLRSLRRPGSEAQGGGFLAGPAAACQAINVRTAFL